MQDYDRAVLVGQKTFGKGLVQTTRPLAYNAQLKVTTAKYYIPSGRCIQALDYAHRNQDGSVDKFADSLKAAFKTKNGRTVYDGGGLDPDVLVDRLSIGSAVAELIQSGLIFEFATRYCSEHPDLKSFQNFRLSDEDYRQFEHWLAEQKFSYSTDLEKQVDLLIVEARKERFYDGLQGNFSSLQSKILQSHQGYAIRFRDEIQSILEDEIGFHQTLNRGRTDVSLKRDIEIASAKKTLNDHETYQKLLKPN